MIWNKSIPNKNNRLIAQLLKVASVLRFCLLDRYTMYSCWILVWKRRRGQGLGLHLALVGRHQAAWCSGHTTPLTTPPPAAPATRQPNNPSHAIPPPILTPAHIHYRLEIRPNAPKDCPLFDNIREEGRYFPAAKEKLLLTSSRRSWDSPRSCSRAPACGWGTRGTCEEPGERAPPSSPPPATPTSCQPASLLLL